MRSKSTWVLVFYVVATVLVGTVLTLATREVFGLFRVQDARLLGASFALSNLVGLSLALLIALYAAFLNLRARAFVEECIAELDKTAWPSWHETRAATLTVVIVSFIAALILGFFDSIFGWLSHHDFFLG
ncbi:MAG: preprotein translocase subunit SecE [Myxococcaceae bacterium]|nr:preprotein translocase subunit SecE [Myxococcaceae bacterium]MBH2006503.1 preprotein translocase subunit SecE [Myxococcaceae bacterium]